MVLFRLRSVLSVVGPDALKKSRKDEERAKRSHDEVSTRPKLVCAAKELQNVTTVNECLMKSKRHHV